jgi:hypothetical protein
LRDARQRPCHLDDDATCVSFSFSKSTAHSRKTDPFFWLELVHAKQRNVKLNRVLKLPFFDNITIIPDQILRKQNSLDESIESCISELESDVTRRRHHRR